MARTNHNYYEFRNKTSKLLSWQIEREETDRLRHSDVKDDGRSLFYSQDINHDFPIFYKALYQTKMV